MPNTSAASGGKAASVMRSTNDCAATSELPAAGPSRHSSTAAWSLSLGVHLFLVLLLASVMRRGGSPPAVRAERRVGIALRGEPFGAAQEQRSQATSAGALRVPGANAARPSAADPNLLPPAKAAAAWTAVPFSLPSVSSGVPDLATPGTARRAQGHATRVPPGSGQRSRVLEAAAERREAEAARGAEAEVRLFGSAAAAGRTFVFLIDRSDSMGQQGLGALQAAEDELIRALAELQSHHRFQVMAYHHRCIFLKSTQLLAATEENKQAVRGHLSGLAAFGATAHERALVAALSYEPDVIFLLTDGGEPPLSAAQLALIHRLAADQTAIHCVQFGFGPRQDRENFLWRLAAQNGGSYGYVQMSGQP